MSLTCKKWHKKAKKWPINQISPKNIILNLYMKSLMSETNFVLRMLCFRDHHKNKMQTPIKPDIYIYLSIMISNRKKKRELNGETITL